MPSYVLNEEKMFCDIADGVAIVINSESGIYYGINAFGTTVFENILNGASTETILTALQSLPEAPADMTVRLNEFIAILLDKELIKTGQAASDVIVSLDAEVAKSNAFALEAREYERKLPAGSQKRALWKRTKSWWLPKKPRCNSKGAIGFYACRPKFP
jgi:hypothetical protein